MRHRVRFFRHRAIMHFLTYEQRPPIPRALSVHIRCDEFNITKIARTRARAARSRREESSSLGGVSVYVRESKCMRVCTPVLVGYIELSLRLDAIPLFLPLEACNRK